jgi:hypothetical protein
VLGPEELLDVIVKEGSVPVRLKVPEHCAWATPKEKTEKRRMNKECIAFISTICFSN